MEQKAAFEEKLTRKLQEKMKPGEKHIMAFTPEKELQVKAKKQKEITNPLFRTTEDNSVQIYIDVVFYECDGPIDLKVGYMFI